MPRAVLAVVLVTAHTVLTTPVRAQAPIEGEVRQLVTFRFQPGRSAEVLDIYRNQVLPLYRVDDAMLSLRGLREVESPVPLDLIIVRGFRGMAGMDASNGALTRIAAESGTSMGSLYGSIAALSTEHHDQFVEMLPGLGNGDPTRHRLVALVWYRLDPSAVWLAEETLAGEITGWERRRGTDASTGRFLVSDGWHLLRIIGFESLADYQDYWAELDELGAGRALDRATRHRRRVIVAPVPELSIRQE